MEGNPRPIAVRGGTVEPDVRLLRRQAAVLERDVVRPEPVCEFAGNREMRRQRNRGKRSPLFVFRLFAGGLPRPECRGGQRGRARRRRDGNRTLAPALAEAPKRPFKYVAPGGGAGELLARELLEIAEAQKVDAGRRELEARCGPRLGA